jgi:hypothetical protein
MGAHGSGFSDQPFAQGIAHTGGTSQLDGFIFELGA